MKGCGLRTRNSLDKRLYDIWRKMHYRCENPTHISYKDYGGRGIQVCKEWDSFVYFGKWAVENGYSANLTLDRIDVNGNYEPTNCQWATPKQQGQNRRKGVHIYVKVDDKQQPMKVIAKSFSVRKRTTKWEYRIESEKIDGKRHQITKSGFNTKEEAIQAAELFIKSMSTDFNQKPS